GYPDDLTWIENTAFGLSLSEYHTGYRAFRREVLETENYFRRNSVAQVVAAGFSIGEIAVPTRCFPEASSANFTASTVYGLKILGLVGRYLLHARGIFRSLAFESLRARTHGWPRRAQRNY